MIKLNAINESSNNLKIKVQSLFKKDMRSTITHPLDVTENPEYNE
jgi:hypothetical protein